MSRHAALYLRVSSDAQKNAGTDARQEESVPKLAANHYPDLRTVDYFEEEGVSATSVPIFDRPQGRRLCDAIAAGEVAVVIADEQSRLVRGKTGAEWAEFFALCQDNNTTIHTDHEGVLDAGETGELIGMFRAWANRNEGRTRNHRIAGGKLAAAKAGRWPFGHTPRGLEKDAEGRLRRADGADAVLAAFQNIADGMPKSRTQAAYQRQTGETISRARFDAMLRQEAYAGRVTVSGELIDGILDPPLVSPELFEKVQRTLVGITARNRKEPTGWPFLHIAKCGACGKSLRWQRQRNRQGHLYSYVACASSGCTFKRVAAAGFSEAFAIYTAALARSADDLMATDPSFAVPTDEPELDELRAAMDEAKAEAQKLGNLIADGILELDDQRYLDALNKRDASQAALDRATGKERDYRDELADFVTGVQSLRATVEPWPTEGFETMDVVRGWHAASFGEQRLLVTRVLERLDVYPDGSTRWTFRSGLAQPLDLEPLFAPSSISARVDTDDVWLDVPSDEDV